MTLFLTFTNAVASSNSKHLSVVWNERRMRNIKYTYNHSIIIHITHCTNTHRTENTQFHHHQKNIFCSLYIYTPWQKSTTERSEERWCEVKTEKENETRERRKKKKKNSIETVCTVSESRGKKKEKRNNNNTISSSNSTYSERLK